MIVLQVGTFKVSELARIKGGADLSWDTDVSRIDSTVVMMKRRARHKNGLTLLIGIKALYSPGIRSNEKTHINCGSSARMAGNVRANVDQIQRQGRSNNTTINGAYLTNLPRELVRSMAGFPTNGRFFYLARAAPFSPFPSAHLPICPSSHLPIFPATFPSA
ncbi:hypothetical protein [Absidia glauca]|uniref:Ndc10 domain-containing protein n=1 Tax=Absidia glauca TaxID=4829 RepID=A0A168Q5U4_ABSGL|nr:hypothetical protein [Absidia glauca]